jgi:hypothetical protein
MCRGVVIIDWFRELSLACLWTAVLSKAHPAPRTAPLKTVAELYGYTGLIEFDQDVLAETSCDNLSAWTRN